MVQEPEKKQEKNLQKENNMPTKERTMEQAVADIHTIGRVCDFMRTFQDDFDKALAKEGE